MQRQHYHAHSWLANTHHTTFMQKTQHHVHSRLAKKLTHFHAKTQLHLHTKTWRWKGKLQRPREDLSKLTARTNSIANFHLDTFISKLKTRQPHHATKQSLRKDTNIMQRQHYHHAKPRLGNTPCKDNANSSLDHSSLNLSLDTHLQTHGLNTLIMKLSCKEHNTMHTQHYAKTQTFPWKDNTITMQRHTITM